jgi:DNA/RNA-binding domain of Phe-tRNA-synthetase-like protein
VIVFQYAPEIFIRYPDLTAGVALAQNIANGPSTEALRTRYQDQQSAATERWGDMPLRDIPSLAAWRRAFREFGVKPTQYRSAPEALLRRLKKQGDIPSINTVVDLMNWVSIKYALPVAAFNIEHLQLPVTVHFSQGDERYTPLGEQEVQKPEPGEVVFSDASGLVVARRWCWRQSDESAVRPRDRNILVTIEAHHTNNRSEVEAALADVEALLAEYVGGTFEGDVLHAEQAALDAQLS